MGYDHSVFVVVEVCHNHMLYKINAQAEIMLGGFLPRFLGLSTYGGVDSQMGKERSEAMRTGNKGFSMRGAEVESGSAKFL